jgi:TPP-dependent pyruvate/acetoin dehydrogenase alpha subunit
LRFAEERSGCEGLSIDERCARRRRDEAMSDPNERQRLELLEAMLRIRIFEDRCEQLFRSAAVKGAMHLCQGQEAVPVGFCSVLRADDSLSFTYRSHGWALARGMSLLSVFAECLGRIDGCNRGRGGSKHLGDWSLGVLPGNAIVAGGVPIVTGVALGKRLTGRDGISVAVFGDGATNQGVLHETMTMASVWNLPVVFVCENNQYAELTPAMEMQPVKHISERASAYGIPAVSCDGMDVEAVAKSAAEVVDRARQGGGPSFVEVSTYRFCGHMTGDPQAYRTTAEIDEWKKRDPIVGLSERLVGAGTSQLVLDELSARVDAAVREAEQSALESAFPDPSDILEGAPSWSSAAR